mgnify:CR=1 FL=1
MKIFKIVLILAISLLYGKSTFSQNKIYKEQVSTKNLINENSAEEVKRENVNLQNFVESFYINSSKFYNQALPAVEKGEYYVLIDRGDGAQSKRIMTKELKDISVDKIEEITYKKSDIYGALHGTFGKMFGIVILKLK